MHLEAFSYVVERGLLMGPQTERLTPIRQRLRFFVDQIRPVERSAREIVETEHRASVLQWNDGLDRVRPPPIAGIDDDAGGKGLSGRGGDERIKMGLGNPRARCVALALNGAVAAFALLGNQINARIGTIESRRQGRPLGPQPDMGEPFLVKGILDKVRLYQPLEEATLVRFGIGNGPDVVKGLLKAVTQAVCSRSIGQCLPLAFFVV